MYSTLAGSSLNAGNYNAARRNVSDGTLKLNNTTGSATGR